MTTTNRLKTATGALRRTIASYSTYAEAERAVDWLPDHGFAVERSVIVGTGLRSVEIGRGASSGQRRGPAGGPACVDLRRAGLSVPGLRGISGEDGTPHSVVALTLHREGDS